MKRQADPQGTTHRRSLVKPSSTKQKLEGKALQSTSNGSGNIFLVGLVVVAVVAIVGLSAWKLAARHALQNQQQAINLGQSAAQDYALGNFQSAETKYMQAVALTANSPSLFEGLLASIGQQGNQTGQEAQAFSKAQPYIAKALSLYPNDEKIQSAVGYLYEIAGKYTDALGYYNKAISLNSSDANAWFHKGHDLEFLGQQQQAFQAYDKAYSIDPDNAATLIAMARESAAKGDVTGTLNYYQQITSLPSILPSLTSEAYTDMADLTMENVLHIANAVTYANEAVSADPNYAPAAAEDGYLLTFTGNPKKGLSLLQQSITLNPRISRNYYLLGVALEGGKAYSMAQPVFVKGLQQVADDNTLITNSEKLGMTARLNYENAVALSHLNNATQALASLKIALQSDPNLKAQLKSDAQRNVFPGLGTNPAFQSLIKS